MKEYTMKDLKSAAASVAAAYGLDIVTASKIIGFFNTGAAAGVKCGDADPEKIAAILAGDLSSVPAAAAAIGVCLGVNTPEKDRQPVQGVKNLPGSVGKIPEKKRTQKPKTEKKEGKANNKRKEASAGGGVETVTGEIIQDTPAGVLPDNVPALVMDVIQSYCDQNNIADLSKERQPRWGAACYMVGQSVFKCSKILHDIQREKVNGGIVYDVGRVSALVDLWGVLCQNFCKAPLIDDFAHFAGLSDSWLYGAGSQDTLTPSRSLLLQKLKRIQENGLSGLIVDGRQNPTGALAALNHWHGWTQTREIIHTSGAASVSAPSLPVFDGSGGLLVDSGGDNGGKSNDN